MYAIDPGKKHSAVAVFLDGELVGAWFASGDTVNMAAERLGRVVMEQPVAYNGPRRENVDPNDLIEITAAGMAVAARLCRPGEKIQTIQPQAWKGQVPKPVTKKRIEGKLTLGERMRLGKCLQEARGERHNVWDAVGIGLHALKRAGRGMT